MEILIVIAAGFGVALAPNSLMAIFVGVVIGQIVGALPGLGPSAGMALLLPVTFGMEPTSAIMMLAGILYGGMYGNSVTSVLINVPGDSSSIIAALDGHKIARQGRAGAVLSMCAIASFCAGTVATIALAVSASAISAFALRFNAPEFFLLAVLGLTASASIGTGSPTKALIMAVIGLMVALVGVDAFTGDYRMTFGVSRLIDGIDFLPVAIGLFGIAEILVSLEQQRFETPITTRFRDLWVTATEWAESRFAIVRGGIIGFMIGMVPGAGATIAAFLAYAVERRFSRHPERFGEGALDGVTASEAANNASVTGAMAPMLALGIPGSAGTAVLLGALILQGFRPGPLLMQQEPLMVWSLIASMFVGNVMLLVLNLPLAPVWASLLRLPYAYLAPGIVVFCLVGSWAATLSFYTMIVALVSGLIGYLMIKADLPRAPLVLAMVLAPIMEMSLRQSFLLSLGSPMIFIQRPFALVLLIVVIGTLAFPAVMALRRRASRKA